MSSLVTRTIARLIDSTVSALSREPFKSVIRQFGIAPYAGEVYDSVRYALADERVSFEVDGHTATFHVPKKSEYSRLRSAKGERTVLTDLLSRLEPDDVFYDVGANIGLYSCFVTNVITDGRVVAFEPHPANVARLKENLALNAGNPLVHQCALSNESGRGSLELHGTEAGAGQHALAMADSDDSIDIELTTGDDVVSRDGVPAPNVIKIDVEGAELDVLRGLRRTVASESCRFVYCEVHRETIGRYGDDPHQVVEFFEQFDFDITRLHDRGTEFFVCAAKRSTAENE